MSVKSAIRKDACLEIKHLTSDEIDYELDIRNVRKLHTREDKIQQLANHIDLNPPRISLEALEPANELIVIRSKVMEIQTLLGEAIASGVIPVRIKSLFIHAVYRLRRVMFRRSDLTQDFCQVGKILQGVQEQLGILYPLLHFPRIVLPDDVANLHVNMSNLSLSQQHSRQESNPGERPHEDTPSGSGRRDSSPQLSSASRKNKKKKKKKKSKKKKSKRRNSSSSSSSTDSSSSSSSSEEDKRRRHRQSNPVVKWSCRFSGKGDRLHEFLEEVEEKADMHDVSNEELLRGIGSLLEGAAKTWHRNNSDISSWSQYKRRMREAFCPSDLDDVVYEKIESLRQTDEETFAVYEARAEELFHRLTRRLEESEKLRILMKGLHYFYRSRIRSRDMTSLRTLRRECHDLEPDKAVVMKMERKAKKSEKKEEEREKKKEFRDVRHTRVHALQTDEDIGCADSCDAAEEEAAAVFTSTPKAKFVPVCWRCGGTGHFSNKCTEKIFCCNCGKADTLAERCSNCATAAAKGMWSAPAQQENQKGTGKTGNPGPSQQPAPYWRTTPPPNYQADSRSQSTEKEAPRRQPRDGAAGN